MVHPDNLFRLASVSKMLTASAIYKLVGAGKLSLSTPVYSYLGIRPWGGRLGDNRIPSITLQHLLDHTGGWNRNTSPVGDPVFDTIQVSKDLGLSYPAAATNVISWMLAKPLDFAPGTTNVYSNFGYQVLGRVIEKASGKRYLDYIQQDLLGAAGILNAIGFTNVIQSRSRPSDLAPWEIWYADAPDLYPSAVDYPARALVRWADGGGYYESFDAFGGLSASAIGLCHYLLRCWEGGEARQPGQYYDWNYTFYGSLPGTTTVLYQNISQRPASTNGLEFAALFNSRDDDPNDNEEAGNAILAAAAKIASWPANGGGMIQWGVAATNVHNNAGTAAIPLLRVGANTLPVKVSFTTYGLSAGNANYVPSSGLVAFAPQQGAQNVLVPILNDGVAGPPRQFLLELISVSGGAWLGERLSCLVTIQAATQPPSFVGSPSFRPDGSFAAQVMSTTGLIMAVEVSTNLVNWQPLQTLTNTTGLVEWIDPTAATRPRSFYRLVAP